MLEVFNYKKHQDTMNFVGVTDDKQSAKNMAKDKVYIRDGGDKDPEPLVCCTGLYLIREK